MPSLNQRFSIVDSPIPLTRLQLEGATVEFDEDLNPKALQAFLDEIVATRPDSEPFTLSALNEIAETITDRYTSVGFVLARVIIPAQTVKDGTVVLRVLEGHLGRVLVERKAETRYTDRYLRAPFLEFIGKPVFQHRMERAFFSLLESPGLGASAVYQAGEEVGKADLVIDVNSGRTFEADLTVDNHGSDNTGEFRARLGATVNNPFRIGDRLSFQARRTADPFAGFLYRTQYVAPLRPGTYAGISYTRDQFDIRGEAVRDPAAPRFDGDSRLANVFVEHTFNRSRIMALKGRIGLTTKLAFTRQTGVGRVLEDRVAVLELGGSWDRFDTWGGGGVNAGLIQLGIGLPGALGTKNTYEVGAPGSVPPSRQGASGAFADGAFTKISGAFTRLQALPMENHSLLFRLEAQYSDDLLTPLDQFSIGGPDSVRAYRLGDVLTDSGVLGSLTLLSEMPSALAWMENAFGVPAGKLSLRSNVFFDYAIGWTNDTEPDDQMGRLEYAGLGAGISLSRPGAWNATVDVATRVGPRPLLRTGQAGTSGRSQSRPTQIFFSISYLLN